MSHLHPVIRPYYMGNLLEIGNEQEEILIHSKKIARRGANT